MFWSNKCFLYGKIVTKVEFKFIIGGIYKSICKFKLELSNGSIINVNCYDLLADEMYKTLNGNMYISLVGRLDSMGKCVLYEYEIL